MPDMIRVLLADDDAAVLSAIEALFGFDPELTIVATAGDGAGALAGTELHDPDVIVLDVRMPGGGPDLVRSVRALRPDASVVCFSADPASRQHMLDAGAFAFVDKADPRVDLITLVKDAHRCDA